ncbi:hypothetical protein BDF19DRAFT_416443 [Syncephalis fuscata]|nr:hypothetical protein BDF19DRAFT_416443 [Syncephalis fuscata]
MRSVRYQFVFARAFVVFFVLSTFVQQFIDVVNAFCENSVIEITNPNLLAMGTNEVEWVVPEELRSAYMIFDVELWSISSGPGGQPGVERKEASFGQAKTDTNSDSNGRYHLIVTVPPLFPGPTTSYFYAVYGRQYINGPAFTTIHPWDPIYYGLKPVPLAARR